MFFAHVLYPLSLGETLLVLASGIVAGLINFGGLWLTISRLRKDKPWGNRLLVSSMIRLSLLGIFFFLIAKENWIRVLPLAVGVLLARFAALLLTKDKPVRANVAVHKNTD